MLGDVRKSCRLGNNQIRAAEPAEEWEVANISGTVGTVKATGKEIYFQTCKKILLMKAYNKDRTNTPSSASCLEYLKGLRLDERIDKYRTIRLPSSG